MSYTSTENINFSSTVDRWLKQNGEISCLIQHSHAAGKKSFEFFQSMEIFSKRLQDLKPRTRLIVFHDRQLSLRGWVNKQFINTALEQIPDGVEYLITSLNELVMDKRRKFAFHSGEDHISLKNHLEEFMGEEIAVGVYPPWLSDGEKVISAIVPEADGSIVTGIY